MVAIVRSPGGSDLGHEGDIGGGRDRVRYRPNPNSCNAATSSLINYIVVRRETASGLFLSRHALGSARKPALKYLPIVSALGALSRPKRERHSAWISE